MTIPDGWLADCASDLKASIAFLTRLPVAGATPAAGADIARAAWAFPLAGVLVALIAAVVYAVAHKIGSPPWVAAALAVDVDYVAFVGSRKKADALKSTLAKRGVAAARMAKLKAPAGLDLGAITPDEIAISIVAEIVAARRSRNSRDAAQISPQSS